MTKTLTTNTSLTHPGFSPFPDQVPTGYTP
jgi:hypothetical protein